MIKFTSLSLRNFFSYGNQTTVVDLSRSGTTTITGINLDDTYNGDTNNGVGKSVIINALTYALYERPIAEPEKIDEIINTTNQKDMYVTVEFTKGEDRYKITRARAAVGDKRGKNFTEILENDVDITPTSRAINQLIESKIGIPYEAFVRIVVFSAMNVPFLKLDAKKSREVIETLFGLTALTNKEAVLKTRIKNTNNDIKTQTIKHEQSQDNYDRYLTQLQSAENRVVAWETSQEEKINKIKKEIAANQSLNITDILSTIDQVDLLNSELKQIKDQRTTLIDHKKHVTQTYNTMVTSRDTDKNNLEVELARLQSVDIDKERERFGQIEGVKLLITDARLNVSQESNSLTTLNNQLKELRKRQTSLEQDISHIESGTCPFCMQEFKDSQTKKQELLQSLHDVNTEIDSIERQIINNETSLQTVTTLMNDLESKLIGLQHSCNFDSIDSLNKVSNDIAVISSKLDDINTSITPTIEQYYTDNIVGLVDVDNEVSNLDSQIEQLDNQIDSHKKKIPTQFIGVHKNDIVKKITDLEVKQNQLSILEQETNPHIPAYEELLNNPVPQPDSTILNKLMVDLEHQKFLQKLLINKDSFIRKTLLNKSIPFLNSRIAYYLEHMGFPYKVEFTPQLTASINRFGKQISFGLLSNGQAARVNLALSFAFRDVLQQIHTPINVCIFDEVLDVGLDGVGVSLAIKLIKQKAREQHLSTFVISHRDEAVNAFENKLIVQMEKRFSYIVE